MVSGPLKDIRQLADFGVSHKGLNHRFGKKMRSDPKKVTFRHYAECRNVRLSIEYGMVGEGWGQAKEASGKMEGWWDALKLDYGRSLERSTALCWATVRRMPAKVPMRRAEWFGILMRWWLG